MVDLVEYYMINPAGKPILPTMNKMYKNMYETCGLVSFAAAINSHVMGCPNDFLLSISWVRVMSLTEYQIGNPVQPGLGISIAKNTIELIIKSYFWQNRYGRVRMN